MKKLILAAFLTLGIISSAFAIPVVNNPNDSFENSAIGVAFAYYQNSGELIFSQNGNTESAADLAAIQALLNARPSFESVVLVETPVTATPYDENSGTWQTNPITNTINFYSVKASNYYALYYVDPAESTGSWSTYDLWALGLGGHPKNGGGGLEISHFSGYGAPVPEPGTIVLLGAGLFGLGIFSRRRMNK